MQRLLAVPHVPRLLRPPEAAANMSSSPLVSRANMDILDELQLIAAQNLERLEVNKYYEVIRELGKGTYGKVDLVIHRMRGEAFCVETFLFQEPGGV